MVALSATVVLVLACTVRPMPSDGEEATAGAAVAPPREEAPAAPVRARKRPLEVYVTGSDDGYLDACGCDTDGLLGGLPRRAKLISILSGGNKKALIVSNGGLVTGTTPIDQRKFTTFVFAMMQMGYAALALTDRELALGREKLTEMGIFLGDGGALLGTNLVDVAPTPLPLPSVPLVAQLIDGESVVVASAVATSRAARYRAADGGVELADPARALQAVLASHLDSEHVIVLAQMNDAEAVALAEAIPAIDWIVLRGGEHEEFPREVPVQVGTTLIVTTGHKGKFLGTLRFGTGGELNEHRSHPIVDTLDKDEDVVLVIDSMYRDWLFIDKPIEEYYSRQPAPGGAAYVGAEEGSCASCHPRAWATWAASKHAHAWQTLVDQDLPPPPDDKRGHQRHAIWDPDCVRCHVTGFGEVSGYAGIERERSEAPLVNVSCEACHGPAGDHAERAAGGDSRWPNGPAPKVATGAAEALCVRCHDPDNSPHFELAAYWAGVIKGVQQPESIAHGREGD